MAHLPAITDATFDTLTRGETPVLVEFGAAWCPPCRMLAPVLEQVQAEVGDRLHVRTLDVDANPETQTRFGISGLPTMILFKDGQPATRFVGFMPRPQLLARVLPHLSPVEVPSP